MPSEVDTPPGGGSTPTPTPNPPNPGWASRGTKVAVAVAVILVLGATATAGYFYKQFADLKKDPNKVTQDETNATIGAVGKLIVLPTGETPTLATVTDPEKLKDQPFFASAKTGYKVLIYTNAKKAILYDPAANKIVEVAPINIGAAADPNAAVSGATTTDDTIK